MRPSAITGTIDRREVVAGDVAGATASGAGSTAPPLTGGATTAALSATATFSGPGAGALSGVGGAAPGRAESAVVSEANAVPIRGAVADARFVVVGSALSPARSAAGDSRVATIVASGPWRTASMPAFTTASVIATMANPLAQRTNFLRRRSRISARAA
ncbi:MAG TPA: hypothetical protein VMM18_00955 [Gemmatimonadaceae bacterium]|nr:hypothetical protein [Gemmatimonadaceae bacterium]